MVTTRRFVHLLLLLILLPTLALAARVEGVRLWTAPDHTRLVFDVDSAVDHKIFALHDPERLVIDFERTGLADGVGVADLGDRFISGVRHGQRKGGAMRVVLDLKQAVKPRTFLLKPNESYGHRLVVDLYARDAAKRPTKSVTERKERRDVVIAIDAGHGGEDPGATGSRRKVREKNITLQIARRLKRLVDAQPGMRGVLTRTGDYYLGLRKRMQLARKQRADLFLSLHADAFHDPRVRGSSVYVLSQRGASSEAAKWLAAKENSSDLIGGVRLDDKDDVLASVLLDLSQSATQHASLAAAGRVYRQLGELGKTHGRRVQHAGFVVLKSPDVPSMLVETGFISSPRDERNLSDPKYQQRLARAIVRGVQEFFEQAPPPGTLLASQRRSERKHVISAGDTLSEIADRYQVSLASLRKVNSIRNDRRIRVGQILKIPGT